MRRAGPLLAGTVVVPDLQAAVSAYAALGLAVHAAPPIDAVSARGYGNLALIGARRFWLGAPGGRPWLRLLERQDAVIEPALTRYGHFALEVVCADLELLARRAEAAGFRHLGGPAPLDVSADIHALQLAGPGGEVLYLTRVDKPLPPFELPRTSAVIDRLFIAVSVVHDRDAARRWHAHIAGDAGLAFDTRIGVLNRALGRDPATRYPVATIQLDGECLFELDEVPGLEAAAAQPADVAGLGWISLACDLDAAATRNALHVRAQPDAQLPATRSAMVRGASGEWIELINAPGA